MQGVEKGAAFLDRRAEEMMVRSPDWTKWLEAEDVDKIRESSTYREQVRESFLNPETEKGAKLPWAKADGFRFRGGEMTIWTGYNGHKKSMVLGQVTLGLVSQGETVCTNSLEMKPVKSLRRMARQFVGCDHPTAPYQEKFFDWAQGNLWFYDHVGTMKPDRMLAVTRYVLTELDCDHCIIDSLMKCGIAEDDLNKQKWFVDSLHSIAHDTGKHVHLVAHSKKPIDGKEKVPSTKYGVAGSANITNIPDNVMLVFKDTSKEKSYDMALRCEKQREGESEPTFYLWFDDASLQHKGSDKVSVMGADDWELGWFK